MSYLVVFIGAGLGGLCRYLSVTTMHRVFSGISFPIGTLFVNLLGCFLIGLIAQLAESRSFLSGDVRLFLTVGFLGGFTTFSSFGYETLQLIRDGQVLYAFGNVALQLLCGLVLVWLGTVVGRLMG